jgi:hypothetical protein
VFFNKRDGNIEGKARDRYAHLRVEVPLSLARARLDAARRIGDHRVSCREHRARRFACPARVVVRAAPEISDSKSTFFFMLLQRDSL